MYSLTTFKNIILNNYYKWISIKNIKNHIDLPGKQVHGRAKMYGVLLRIVRRFH